MVCWMGAGAVTIGDVVAVATAGTEEGIGAMGRGARVGAGAATYSSVHVPIYGQSQRYTASAVESSVAMPEPAAASERSMGSQMSEGAAPDTERSAAILLSGNATPYSAPYETRVAAPKAATVVRTLWLRRRFGLGAGAWKRRRSSRGSIYRIVAH